jgi:hypothetical protein
LINADLQSLPHNSSSTQSFHPETTPYTSPSGEEFLQVYDTIWISEDKVVISANAPTRIEDTDDAFNLDIYPNPSKGVVSILMLTPQAQEVEAKVYDLLGKKMDEFKLNTNQSHGYQMGEWNLGMYVFVFDVNGRKISRKISLFE